MCQLRSTTSRKRSRTIDRSPSAQDGSKACSSLVVELKRLRSRTSPTAVDEREEDECDVSSETEDSETEEESDEEEEEQERATAAHRDEIVAALLTITAALGLSKETLHVCVDLLDRYLHRRGIETSRLEALSIACLWIAVKFVETPVTIASKNIKMILQRRRLSGNWTWNEILDFEREVLVTLNYRVMAPTLLSLLQHQLYSSTIEPSADNNFECKTIDAASLAASLSSEQRDLAMYFADLLLLSSRASAHSKYELVSAAVFVAAGCRVQDSPRELLPSVLLVFLLHRDIINPAHPAYKARFALRCQFGTRLQAPWQVPFDSSCGCRVCENKMDQPEFADV